MIGKSRLVNHVAVTLDTIQDVSQHRRRFMFSCCSSWDLLQCSPLLDAPGESASPGETSGPEESEGPTAVQVSQSGRGGCKGPGQGRRLLADAPKSF